MTADSTLNIRALHEENHEFGYELYFVLVVAHMNVLGFSRACDRVDAQPPQDYTCCIRKTFHILLGCTSTCTFD
jgi:hypothetical protein